MSVSEWTRLAGRRKRDRALLVPKNHVGQRLPARHPSQDRAAIESFGSLPREDALAYVGKS
jgi:hypothetical protein